MNMHKVYLIGAGPGDPGLITQRGLQILRQAEVIIYDYLVDKRILDEADEGAELICCDTLGKKRYSDSFLVHNEKINEIVIKKVKEGKKVIRLKNGDPGIFSRTSQELEPLVKNQIDFEIVPGVTAASAASCLSGIPLTDRRFTSSCVFVTGHEDPSKKESSLDWEGLSRAGTIVLYMSVENLPKIVKRLTEAGRSKDTEAAIVQETSLPTQKILIGTLKDITVKAKKEKVRPPAMIIIGEVVKLAKMFNWQKRTRQILFTGLSRERFFTRERFFHLPLIKIAPMKDYKEFDAKLKDIESYDWLVFASRYGVEYFFKRLIYAGLDARAINGIKIAAIGRSTKNRLLDFGISADLTPKKESSEGLLEEFGKMDIRGKRIFMPRSNIADKGLTEGFEKLGAVVTAAVAYRNIMPEAMPNINWDNFDEIMFTSPSTVRNFKKRYGKIPTGVKVRCIGEVTRNEIKKK